MKEQKCKTSPLCSHNTNGRDMDKPCSVEFVDPKQTPKHTTSPKMHSKPLKTVEVEEMYEWHCLKASCQALNTEYGGLMLTVDCYKCGTRYKTDSY